MKIQTSLICILIISLFVLHHCARMEVREIDKSNIIISSNCYNVKWFKKFGWCCKSLKGIPCWHDKASCDKVCPPPHYPPKKYEIKLM
ncbi:hypothetical protein YC2023_093993 [Brassica napus]